MLQTIVTILYVLLILTVVVVILVDNGDSGRKFAWLLIIAAIPLFGILLYFMFGINYRHHWIFNRRHQKYKDIFEKETNEDLNRILFGHDTEALVREDFRPLAEMMGRGAYPSVTAGNDVEIITEGKRKFELLSQDILQARENIHMEYFHFGNDKGSRAIKELLMQKAREGVKVRFINENIANFPISSKYYDDMREAGVEVVRFTNPRAHLFDLVTTLNYRNHRKIVVIDGKIGYTGGMNINDHYFEHWRDTHMRLTGKAVASLQYAFMDSWLTGGGTIDRPMLEYYPMAKELPSSATTSGGSTASLRSAPPLATLRSAPVPPLNVPRVAVVSPARVVADGRPNDSEHSDSGSLRGSPLSPPRGCRGVDCLQSMQNMHTLLNKVMQIVPDEPDLPLPMLLYSYEWAITHAKKYIWFQTPYFVPPEPVLDAMKIAALTGIDIRLMLPEAADNFIARPANRAYYEEILGAGVRLFLRQGEFIHSKTFVCDDYLSSIGSANMDARSFGINYEINTYIYDEEAALMNKAIFEKDLEKCRELTLEEWSRRPWYKRLLESVIRLFAPLL
ncbi:MAG: PLDc N-terminal domain-containing protein [Bacteroidales bacterium]|nr:PLDc N-terminal domain-containing protein [Bacteroidales bacterium]